MKEKNKHYTGLVHLGEFNKKCAHQVDLFVFANDKEELKK